MDTVGTGRHGIAGRLPITLLLVVVAVAATWLAWRTFGVDPERAAITAERNSRHDQWQRGQALPGTPDLADLNGRLAANGLTLGAPVFIRIFKREFELELWMKRDDRYHRLAVYPVCRWSGQLGPKLIEGDAQAPEGFYTLERRSLNPNSRWHRAFNLGFPNAFDRAHGRTGSFLMVHGGCSSIGCYAMTNPVVDELWRLVDAALRKGQPRIHVHVFPFRPSPDNLAAHGSSKWQGFWTELAAGYEAFEETHIPPQIGVCDGHYRVKALDEERAGPAPAVGAAATACASAHSDPPAATDRQVRKL